MVAHSDPLACALFLIVGLTIAGLLHSAWLRAPVSRRLAIPLDGGLTLRGHRLFGDNKTVRGFVAIVPAGALTFAALAWTLTTVTGETPTLWPLDLTGYAALGAWAAFGLMAGELPNSFIKRQLGIPPGEAPRSRTAAVLCFAGDRLDSILGMLVAVSLAAPTPWLTWLWVVLIGSAVHWSFSVLLHRLGVKHRPA